MAILHLKDGTKKRCAYNTAALIVQIKDGVKKPDNEKQALFVENVAHVVFDELPEVKPNVVKSKPPAEILEGDGPHDPEVKRILESTLLNGREKARQVANRLRERNVWWEY